MMPESSLEPSHASPLNDSMRAALDATASHSTIAEVDLATIEHDPPFIDMVDEAVAETAFVAS